MFKKISFNHRMPNNWIAWKERIVREFIVNGDTVTVIYPSGHTERFTNLTSTVHCDDYNGK